MCQRGEQRVGEGVATITTGMGRGECKHFGGDEEEELFVRSCVIVCWVEKRREWGRKTCCVELN